MLGDNKIKKPLEPNLRAFPLLNLDAMAYAVAAFR